MTESVKKILFVNSEIEPYLPKSEIAHIGRYLPQGIQEKGKEIRSFMPRFGCINERKNQLHEVIRLSGMNIVIDSIDRPLIIKVASISAARMQIYFIDNEDYFKRKKVYHNADGVFFEDNAERAMFFARGVLETAKKLRWAPDVIHCQGWISHFLPAYLKKEYKDDPIFSNCKIVLSLYDEVANETFKDNTRDCALFGKLKAEDLPFLETANTCSLAKTAVQYSDGVILASENINTEVLEYAKSLNLPILEHKKGSTEDGSYIDNYNDFYSKVTDES